MISWLWESIKHPSQGTPLGSLLSLQPYKASAEVYNLFQDQGSVFGPLTPGSRHLYPWYGPCQRKQKFSERVLSDTCHQQPSLFSPALLLLFLFYYSHQYVRVSFHTWKKGEKEKERKERKKESFLDTRFPTPNSPLLCTLYSKTWKFHLHSVHICWLLLFSFFSYLPYKFCAFINLPAQLLSRSPVKSTWPNLSVFLCSPSVAFDTLILSYWNTYFSRFWVLSSLVFILNSGSLPFADFWTFDIRVPRAHLKNLLSIYTHSRM